MTIEGSGEMEGSGPEDADLEKVRRLTPAAYAEIRELFELGTTGVSDLSDKFGISRQALSRRFKDDGVVRGSRAAEAAEAARKAAVAAPSAPAAAILERFSDKREGWVEETRVGSYNNMTLVERLTKKIIQESLNPVAPKPLSSFDDELKAIERIKKIFVETARHKLVDILNADEVVDEDSLPNLMIEDLTDQEILEHHILIGALPEDATLEDLHLDEDVELDL
jgi:hypothetical protein